MELTVEVKKMQNKLQEKEQELQQMQNNLQEKEHKLVSLSQMIQTARSRSPAASLTASNQK